MMSDRPGFDQSSKKPHEEKVAEEHVIDIRLDHKEEEAQQEEKTQQIMRSEYVREWFPAGTSREAINAITNIISGYSWEPTTFVSHPPVAEMKRMRLIDRCATVSAVCRLIPEAGLMTVFGWLIDYSNKYLHGEARNEFITIGSVGITLLSLKMGIDLIKTRNQCRTRLRQSRAFARPLQPAQQSDEFVRAQEVERDLVAGVLGQARDNVYFPGDHKESNTTGAASSNSSSLTSAMHAPQPSSSLSSYFQRGVSSFMGVFSRNGRSVALPAGSQPLLPEGDMVLHHKKSGGD